MAANLSSLTPVVTAATTLSNLTGAAITLVTPNTTVGYQPQNPLAAQNLPPPSALPPAFVFNYEGEQTAAIESDITDHYVENNTAIQDQIALRPVTITTHGFIAELNDIAPTTTLATLQKAAQTLQTISAYTPALSTTAILAYNTAFQLYQVAINAKNAAVSAWASATGQASGVSVINGTNIGVKQNQNKQQLAFQTFYGYWTNRTLFTIQTPWAIFTNMAIKSIRAIQDETTRTVTDFEMQFKQIRFAYTETTPASSNASGRLQAQASSQVSLGIANSVPGPASNPTAIAAFPGLAAK